MDKQIFIIFALIWAATFFPSWALFLRLVSMSTSESVNRRSFIITFTAYRLLIIAPYAYLLIAGAETLPGVVKAFVVGFILAGLTFSILRMFFRDYVVTFLWGLYAFVYDGLVYFYPYQKLQELIVAAADPQKGERIVDLGCGTGNTSLRLASMEPGADLVAVDSSQNMLKRAEKKLKSKNATVKKDDATSFLAKQESSAFDKIILTNVLYALSDRDAFWEELLRVLRADGTVIITNSDKPGSRAIIKEHLNHAPRLSLLRPKLLAVFIVDYFISELSKTGQFSFISEDTIKKEVSKAGGIYTFIERCYGGKVDGVNLLFTVKRKT